MEKRHGRGPAGRRRKGNTPSTKEVEKDAYSRKFGDGRKLRMAETGAKLRAHKRHSSQKTPIATSNALIFYPLRTRPRDQRRNVTRNELITDKMPVGKAVGVYVLYSQHGQETSIPLVSADSFTGLTQNLVYTSARQRGRRVTDS